MSIDLRFDVKAKGMPPCQASALVAFLSRHQVSDHPWHGFSPVQLHRPAGESSDVSLPERCRRQEMSCLPK